MKIHKSFILNILLAILPVALHASDEYSLLKIDYSQGLSHSAVLSIFQDDWGLMWFGTYDGLDNYDGHTMEVYRTDETDKKQLLNNVIYDVDAAEDHSLWITTNKGVNRFSLKKRCVTETHELFSSEYQLVSNREGTTWVLDGHKLYWYDPQESDFREMCQVEKSFQENLSFVDDKDYLWLFSSEDNSIFRYKAKRDKDGNEVTYSMVRANIHPVQIKYASYQNGILSLVDKQMNLYIFDIERNTKVYIRNVGELVKAYGDIKGIVSFYDDIVIAFIQNGLMRLEAANQYRESFIDRNLRIFSIYKDPVQNTIWVGTDGQGVVVCSKKKSMSTQLMFSQMLGKITRQVRSIYTDSLGNLWFGTKGDGLIRVEHYEDYADEGFSSAPISVYFPRNKRSLPNYERGGSEFQIFGITPSRYASRLWIGSADKPGLSYYDYRQDMVIPLEGDTEALEKVHWLYEENDSTLWMTTSGNGVCRVVLGKEKNGVLTARHTRQFIFKSDDGKEIGDFFPLWQDCDSLIWLGSRGRGLVKFNIRTEAYTIYQPGQESKRSTNDILSIYRKNDTFYLGTVSGLVRMTLDEKGQATFSCIGKEQGFLNDMIHGILEDDDGFLWLSTNKGLVKYNPENNVFHTYYYSNGLQIGEFSDDAFHKCRYSGKLFFGGINGLLYLEKKGVDEAEHYPELCFRGLTLGMEPANFYDYYDEESQTLTLKGNRLSFSLSFVAPDFVDGDNFEYSYRLEGKKDTEWSAFSSKPVAVFNELPCGDYTLRVQYKKDAFDSEYPSFSLHISILPPWYLSSWAYTAYLLIFIVLLAYAVLLARRFYRRERLIRQLMKHETGVSWETDMSLDSYLPTTIETEGDTKLKDLSDAVLSRLSEEGIKDLSDIHTDINEDLRVTLPSFALGYILHFLYARALRDKVPAALSASMEEGVLSLWWQVPDAYTVRLLSEKEEEIPAETAEGNFNLCLYRWLYQYALKAMKVTVTCELGKGICYLFPVQEHTRQAEQANKKKLLLLENKIEIVWLVENMLSDIYTVKCVHTLKEAFDSLRQDMPDVFLADTLIYLKEEQKFMEYVNANKGLLARTAVVLMLTWKAADLLHRRFMGLVDSFVVMPFSILFLREIVDMAVRRISDDKNAILTSLAEPISKESASPSPEQTEFMEKLTAIVEENLDTEDLGASFLAEKMFLSPRQFYRKFKEINGVSPTDFIKNYRLEKAARLLTETDLSITDVVSEVGIISRSYFYKEFFYKFGMTPKEYRQLKLKQK
ncbi:MAG: helix-turn-helix domain-containing protein [Bacteroidales bacterium]|nr:helix-turn-helix domain-containing protein [Bacteroidales bacterium]